KIIDRTLVLINDEPILESDVSAFQKRLKSKSFQELFGGIPNNVIDNRDAALQLLIEERLVNQQVKKLELNASDQEVEAQIKSILKRNAISQSQLVERLKQLGSSLSEYKDGIRRQIERRNLIDREIRPSLELSDEQLRHYYLRNASPEETEQEYKLAHIFLGFKDSSSKAKKDAETRANEVWRLASEKGSDFQRLAKEYSDDSESPDGVLGYFSVSSLSKEFKPVIPKVKVGQVTKPIQLSDGFHILKLLEVRSPDFSTLPKEKREAIRNQMAATELEKKMALWIEKKKKESNISVIGNSAKETP
ncbi:MAG: peptidylprolyl isomerase, partial [Deltaproteobacteria bacterium]